MVWRRSTRAGSASPGEGTGGTGGAGSEASLPLGPARLARAAGGGLKGGACSVWRRPPRAMASLAAPPRGGPMQEEPTQPSAPDPQHRQALQTTRQPAQVQPLIVIRVKRKRSDAPVEELAVTESVVERPKKRVNLGGLTDSLAELSTAHAGGGSQGGNGPTGRRAKRRRDFDADDAEQTYIFTRLKGNMGMSTAASGSAAHGSALAEQLEAAGLTLNSDATTARSTPQRHNTSRRRREPAPKSP